MTGKFTQFQELNKDQKKEDRDLGKITAKKLDTNMNFGMSADYPMNTGVFHQVYRNSSSLYEKRVNSPENYTDGAGIGFQTAMHQFLCYNGKPEKAQYFANLINNSTKQDIKTQFVDESRFDGTRYTAHPLSPSVRFFRGGSRIQTNESKQQFLRTALLRASQSSPKRSGKNRYSQHLRNKS